eukprot:779645-Prymnesium_polylepis.1
MRSRQNHSIAAAAAIATNLQRRARHDVTDEHDAERSGRHSGAFERDQACDGLDMRSHLFEPISPSNLSHWDLGHEVGALEELLPLLRGYGCGYGCGYGYAPVGHEVGALEELLPRKPQHAAVPAHDDDERHEPREDCHRMQGHVVMMVPYAHALSSGGLARSVSHRSHHSSFITHHSSLISHRPSVVRREASAHSARRGYPSRRVHQSSVISHQSSGISPMTHQCRRTVPEEDLPRAVALRLDGAVLLPVAALNVRRLLLQSRLRSGAGGRSLVRVDEALRDLHGDVRLGGARLCV